MNVVLRCTLYTLVLFIAAFPLFPATDFETDLEKAKLLFNSGRIFEARELLESLTAQNEKISEAWFYLGRIAQSENRLNDAEKYFKRAIKLDEFRSPYHHWLGRIYGMQAINASVFRQPFLARNSRRSFETAVELDPDNIEARFDLVQFYIVAPGIVGGSSGKAYEHAEAIKQRDSIRGHGAYGFIYSREDEFDKAEREFIAARDLEPANPDPYYWLGFLYVRMENYSAAFDQLDTLISYNPELMPAYYQYGRIAALSGERIERGMKYLEKYLGHSPAGNEPSHAWAHVRLGELYDKIDEADRAREHYKKALTLDPDLKPAREALRR
jgi:tetratricopeptide (TPR) repeat protein